MKKLRKNVSNYYNKIKKALLIYLTKSSYDFIQKKMLYLTGKKIVE